MGSWYQPLLLQTTIRKLDDKVNFYYDKKSYERICSIFISFCIFMSVNYVISVIRQDIVLCNTR